MVQTVKPTPSTWCPGCGDFGVLAALKKAGRRGRYPRLPAGPRRAGSGAPAVSTTSWRSTGSMPSTVGSSPRRSASSSRIRS